MTKKNVLRKAQARDSSQIARCLAAAYAPFVKRIAGFPDMTSGIEKEIAENQVWVAANDREILACLFLVRADDHMKLANIAVDPDHSGKGFGRKLMELAEQEARQQNFRTMRLNTHIEMPENVALYKHFGWQETGRQGVTVFMEKRLA